MIPNPPSKPALRSPLWAVAAAVFLTLTALETSLADRVLLPTQGSAEPVSELDTFTLTPDGSTVIATGTFHTSPDDAFDFVYSFPVPANPATDIVTPTQLSIDPIFDVPRYDVVGTPAVSPDGATILFEHDRGTGPDTIHTMPIGGEFFNASFTGLFSGSSIGDPSDNFVAPGAGNFAPAYSPDGANVFFINDASGLNGADRLYRLPTAGGSSPTALTPDNQDIDQGGFVVTPDSSTVFYASAGNTALFSIPAAGGTSTQVPLAAAPHDGFAITGRIDLTPDGQTLLFVGDYEAEGRSELFSVPVTGGTPTRISDDLAAGGEVTNFAIAPDGLGVAYAAGQNAATANELFFTPIAGGVGASRRISDPAAVLDGTMDVATFRVNEVIRFSNDSQSVFYLGDMTENGLQDLYIVDTTEKLGGVPTVVAYTYVGAADGEFFQPTNWEGPGAENPAATSLVRGTDLPSGDIELDLTISDTTVNASGDLDFGENATGALRMTNATLNVTGDNSFDIDFDSDSVLEMTDSTIATDDNMFFGGQTTITGGQLDSGDDVNFQETAALLIDGTTINTADNFRVQGFDAAVSSVVDVTINASDRFSVEARDVVFELTDATIIVNGGNGDLEDTSTALDGNEAGTLLLMGSSSIQVDDIREGADLILGGSSTAIVGINLADEDEGDAYVGSATGDTGVGETISLISADASLTVPTITLGAIDPRDFIINGVTGLSYSDDPTTWNITDWDGATGVTLSITVGQLIGDYNEDGIVDAADYTVYRDNLGTIFNLPNRDPAASGLIGPDDYAAWRDNYGATSPPPAIAVPEPISYASAACAMAIGLATRRQRA